MRSATAAVLLLSLAAGSLPAQAPLESERTALPPRPQLTFDPARLPEPQRVLDLLDYTATAQIAQLRNRPVTLTGGSVTQVTANWVAAAFYTGASRLLRVSPRSGAGPFLREVAEHYNYALRGAATPRAMINADDQAIGELYQELYARSGQPGMIMPLRQRLDYTVPFLELDPAPKRLVWWWCDALFMAPPVLARMTALTGDTKYLRAMDTQWWRTHDRLWDRAENLYFRDERFLDRRSERGKKIFWGRGNGWVVGGLVRVLDTMPKDFAHRPRYIETYQAMMAKLATLQRTDGLWPTSLLDQDAIAGPESSGSAFFVYGMAWGINHGLLDRKTYLPHVLRGWAGLANIIGPDGLLGYVQRTGDQPVPSGPDSTGFYGTGALLLAGLEVMKLGDRPTPLPVPEPTRDPAIFAPPSPPPAPPPATADEAREAQRWKLEREAGPALSFDPATGY